MPRSKKNGETLTGQELTAAIRDAILRITGQGDDKKMGAASYRELVRQFGEKNKDTINRLLRDMGVGGRDANMWRVTSRKKTITVKRRGR